MHQTAGTATGPRWELVAYVASSVLFAAAVVGLFLPRGLDEAVPGRESTVVAAMVGGGLALGVRRTRRAAVARAIVAAAGAAPLGVWFLFVSGFEGPPEWPEWMGAWVTFWALIGAFVANVLAASAGRRPSTGREGPNARTPPGVQGP